MFSATLIGLDGVGKTTIAKRLEHALPMPVKYLYMGMNFEAGNCLLPTTRWWSARQRREAAAAARRTTPAPAPAPAPALGHTPRVLVKTAKKTLGFINRLLEEWCRELVALHYIRQGHLVLFDRHFIYDYYHADILPGSGHLPWKRRVHGFMLRHLIREPDLVICLDAPGEVAFGRKREFSVPFLESRRRDYLSLRNAVRNFVIVDANRDLESVVGDVRRAIVEFHDRRRTHG